MGFTNTEQLYTLFLCGGMGFLLGAYYDGFRLLRLLLHPPTAGVFALDCLFCVTAAPVVFLFSLAVADGILRVYVFAGLLLGFFAYRRTVGRALLRTVYRLLRAAHRLKGRVGAFLRAKRPKKFKKGLATDTVDIV